MTPPDGPSAPPAGPTRARPNGWGLTEALAGFVVGLVLASASAAAAAAGVGYHRGSGAPYPVAVTVADVVALWVGLAGAAVIAARRHRRAPGRRLGEAFGLAVGRWWDLPLGVVAGLASQYLLVPGLYLPFEAASPQLAHRLAAPAATETGAVHGPAGLLVVLAVLAVGAPVVEELYFRGLVLRGLLGRLPAPLAVLASALLFGLAHFEPLQFAGLAAFGVVLGALAWATGRLAPSICAHAAFNAAAVLTVVHLR